MRFQSVCLFAVILLLFGCTESHNSTISLNGNDWQFAEVGKNAQWQKATVPGTVQTDLLALGEIPDPFVGMNEDSIQWISERDWVYKKKFVVSSEVLQKKSHWLRFEGLDTYSEVRLNDSLILSTANAFRSYEIDVSWMLQEKNQLSITFRSNTAKEEELAQQLSYQLPESPRVFTRKPQFQYGWDWGPTIKTMGIWRGIELLSYDDLRINDLYVETTSLDESAAELMVHLELSVIKAGTYNVEVHNKNDQTILSRDIMVSTGKTFYSFPMIIAEPIAWSTHNLDGPYLYDIEVHLKNGSHIVDSISQKMGLRTIELVTEKDSIGESFHFKLNGKPVYMKGANYIPQNIFLPQVTKDDRVQLLDDALEANMNMLRVWGGGIYEDDAFYELCNEKGMLLWQDFMFACAMYPGDDAFLENVKAEAIDNVKRLRKHPSIALWCGNNENSEGWNRWGWQEGKSEQQKAEIWGNYQKLFNGILPAVVDSLHTSVAYWESSPKYGRGDKRYQFEGDAHDWWVWHDGYPFEHYEEEVPRFMSEFGFQAFPSLEAIRYFTEQDSLDLTHPSFQNHQKHARGFQLIREYMTRDFLVPSDAEDYVYVSQLLQAHGITKGIRAHRRAKPYNMGTLYWQLNDCWPAVSWSSIDGLGNWKALHYKVKAAFKNRLIVPWEDNGKLKVAIVEDHLNSKIGSLYVTIKDFFGNLRYTSDSVMIETNTETNEAIYELDLKNIDHHPESTFAEVHFGDETAIHFFVKPKDLELTPQQIELSEMQIFEGSEIEIKSASLQKDVFLIADVPGHFSDNFFDLMPGEVKAVQFTPAVKMPFHIRYKTLNSIREKQQSLNKL